MCLCKTQDQKGFVWETVSATLWLSGAQRTGGTRSIQQPAAPPPSARPTGARPGWPAEGTRPSVTTTSTDSIFLHSVHVRPRATDRLRRKGYPSLRAKNNSLRHCVARTPHFLLAEQDWTGSSGIWWALWRLKPTIRTAHGI